MKLILASASPRRAEILRNAGFHFDILPANVDESRLPNERAEDYVQRLASEKAQAAAALLATATAAATPTAPPALIIGADTVVSVDNHILGKPSSLEDARWMLRTLSSRSHQVFTGLSLLSLPARTESTQVDVTKVTFANLSEPEIESYLASSEPFDKAGAYAIQGIAGRYVTRIEGCYFNVMGLPLSRLYAALKIRGGTYSHGPHRSIEND